MNNYIIIEGVIIVYLLWRVHCLKNSILTLIETIQNMAGVIDNSIDDLKIRVGDLEINATENEDSEDDTFVTDEEL